MSYGMTAGIAGFAASMMFKPSRDLLNEHVLPKPGDGPSKSEQENGYFDIRFFGYTNKNHLVMAVPVRCWLKARYVCYKTLVKSKLRAAFGLRLRLWGKL